MTDRHAAPRKAVVLWLSGARLDDIRPYPEVERLLEHGALIELEPLPIAEPRTQHYQVLSGRSPASFGLFDTLVPRDYTVKEESAGRGTTPKLFPDLLRTVGWTVEYEEAQPPELISCVQRWTQSAPASQSCLIVKCVMHTSADTSSIDAALHIAREWVGETGMLAVLSDTQPASVECFVNVNNFLNDMGVMERDESGKINWANSLAYYAGNGQLWVNLLGRDVQGSVHPQDEYEEVRGTLIKALPLKLRDGESGEPVIERIYRKEELYSGDYLFCAPDLVVVFKAGYAPSPRSTRLGFDEATFTKPTGGEITIAGAHPSMLKGFLLASAPALAVGIQAPEQAPLTAIVPTILHALGVEYTDGEVPALSMLFTPSYLETHPVRSVAQGQELSEEEEELIISHLRDLGYV